MDVAHQPFARQPSVVVSPRPVRFVWLELTGQCNLSCIHCYANSSPHGTHGTLTRSDWRSVIAEARASGADTVQFIGGEPTLHPHFVELVRFAAGLGLAVEVFSNLVRVPTELWELFADCRVALATSFYSSLPTIHDDLTTRRGSQRRTLANIQEALARSIPLRVGLIHMSPAQDTAGTEQMLRSLGVEQINIDDIRGIGRGTKYQASAHPNDQLCGRCALGTAMIDPDGWVYPCVFARWLRVGNVRAERFSEIVAGEGMRTVRADLEAAFAARLDSYPCQPNCGPAGCSPNCSPSVGCIPPPRPPSPCPPRR